MIKNLVALPYELARLPLVLADKNLGARLPEDSGTRLTLDRAIGSADKLAGAVLRNRDIADRGAERVDRARKLATAVHLEKEADASRDQAREAVDAARQDAAQKRAAAHERAASGLEEADVAEARGKQQARSDAAKAAAKKKAAADKQAASRTATVEQRKSRVASAADAKKAATQRKAKAELDDARETKQAAGQARAAADRLGDLTEAKKQERKQG